MNYYLGIFILILSWLAFPIIYVLHLLLSVLSTVLSPLIHLSHYIAFACWYPFSLLPNFETLYIFIGVAVVVGAVTGLTLHGASKFVTALLRLDHPLEKPRGRTLESYRAGEEERRAKKDPLGDLIRESVEKKNKPLPIKDEMLDWIKREQGRGRNNGMIPNTILEEDDTSESGL